MANFHQLSGSLCSHFSELQSQRRESTVYLIEHDIHESSIGGLFDSVSSELNQQGVAGDNAEAAKFLPLLVAATEVAYQYEGNGTDYWPKLEQQVDYSFTLNDRVALKDLLGMSR